MKAKLSAKNVATFALPRGKDDLIVWDTEIEGFGLRIRAGGSRKLIVQYRLGTKQRRVNIGLGVPEAFTGPDNARKRAETLLAKVSLGTDVASEKVEKVAKASHTFGKLVDRYLPVREHGHDGEKKLRPRSLAECTRYLRKACKPLHGLSFDSVTQQDVATLLNDLRRSSGDATANRCRQQLMALWGYALRQGLTVTNPVANTAESEETPRDRVLTSDEIVEILNACTDEQPFFLIVQLLFQTGCRRDEIGGLLWSEISRVEVPASRIDKRPAFTIECLDLPPDRTKNGRRHVVPLTPAALATLKKVQQRAGYDSLFGASAGYSGWSFAKRVIDRRISEARDKAGLPAMSHWTFHDIRRTFVTQMGDELGVMPHVVEALVNHISSVASGRSGAARHYNWATYLKERVDALNLWSDHLAALTGANVVKLKRRARR